MHHINMELNDKSLVSNDHYICRRYSESIEADSLFADPNSIDDKYTIKQIDAHQFKDDSKKEGEKKDEEKKEEEKKDEAKSTFELPMLDPSSTRKLSHLPTTPSYSPWVPQENKFFDLSELSLGKNKFSEDAETPDTDPHKEPRERRLDSFCLEENTYKLDLKKFIEETVAPARPTTAGLLVKIDQIKINNNEEGAVTIQDNTQYSAKKKRKPRTEEEETELESVARLNENGMQYMNDVITNISNTNSLPINLGTYKVGSLTLEERRQKITKYKEKRMRRTWSKKISYDCRKRVADNRLRVKGRFVTKDQAFALLGMTPQDLCENESIKQLLSDSSCSIVTTTNNIKIRNIQTLLQSPKDKVAEEEDKPYGIDVEIVSKNQTDNTVEIKIEKRKTYDNK